MIAALILVPVAMLFWQSPAAEKPKPPQLDISYGFSATLVSGVSDTHHFQAEIRDTQVAKHPIWDSSTKNPPVSITDVMVAAQEYRDTLVANKQFPDHSQIIDVKLVPIDSRDHLWFWIVTFRVPQAGNPIEEIEIAVLMDGSVVPHEIHRRLDTGWPPPDQSIIPHESELSDTEIVEQFILNLNVDRKFAGQTVKITGTLQRIPDDHPHRKTGHYEYFVTNNGHKLLFWFPHPVPRSSLEGELNIKGKLLGFRDLSDKTESWDNVKLFPGIRATALGQY